MLEDLCLHIGENARQMHIGAKKATYTAFLKLY
jgi:hypothetical protein